MSETLEDLQLQRDVITKRVESILKFAKNAKRGDSDQLESRKHILKELGLDFFKLQDRIFKIEIKDNINSDNDQQIEEYDTLYHNAMSETLSKLKKYETSSPQTKLSNAPVPSSIKLPVVNLPSFDGQMHKWLPFYNTFKSLVADNPDLDEFQKFYYLKSSLQGDALRAIDSLPLSDSSYASGFAILIKRYNNTRLIVQDHVQAIINAAQVSKSSHVQLRQLLDTINNSVESLKNLKVPVDKWDAIVVQLILPKLDYTTRRDYELTLDTEIPRLSECLEFLEKRCRTLASLDNSNKITEKVHHLKTSDKPKPFHNQNYKARTVNVTTQRKTITCQYCSKLHYIHTCPEFLNLSSRQRHSYIQKTNACVNCLRPGHSVGMCKSQGCKICCSKHNSLLHDFFNNQSENANSDAREVVSVASYCSQTSVKNSSQVLLSTATVLIADAEGIYHKARALLDNASQINLITDKLSEKLGIKPLASKMSITGVGKNTTFSSGYNVFSIKSLRTNYVQNINCQAIPKITCPLPNFAFSKRLLDIPSKVVLADAEFNVSKEVDILLGTEIFYEILLAGRFSRGNLHYIETRLGWVIGGTIGDLDQTNNAQNMCHVTVKPESSLEEVLEKFWQDEEISHDKKQISPEEQRCENNFLSTYRRDASDGRFVVQLPFKHRTDLGNSYGLAMARLKSLENKFIRDAVYHQNYQRAMQDYLEAGVMEIVPHQEINNPLAYYLPHSGVVKESSSTTKLRVVFDGSAKPRNGLSLNDCLMNGPTIQDDLFSLVIRFRTYRYAMTADISKMYLQIKLEEQDQDYQRVLWRASMDEPVGIYRLKTVTFGLTPSSFLAIRCLNQLAEETKSSHPHASKALIKGFYVDDLNYGADTLDEALKIQKELIAILSSAGFVLRKWAANHSALTDQVDKHTQNTGLIDFFKNDYNLIKTLGIGWNPITDRFVYQVKSSFHSNNATKRIVLSCIARLYDPLGLLSPVIIRAKVLMQDLWLKKLEWDAPIPEELRTAWLKFVDELKDINNISVPRNTIPFFVNLEMHAFGDASQRALGAAVYLRAEDNSGNVSVHLIAAKSKVAPLKTISLPRLELNAAVMAARLTAKLQKAMQRTIHKRHLWSDSTIVLQWISAPAINWQAYVGNRVAEIHSLTSCNEWKHIRSQLNPADLITRGQSPSNLQGSFWFSGPPFLMLAPLQWPTSTISEKATNDNVERERRRNHIMVTINSSDYDFLTKFSKFSKLVRVVAYCKRWLHNRKNKNYKQTADLNSAEVQNAHDTVIKIVQSLEFSQEVRDLSKAKAIHKDSKLRALDPFIDKQGIIRVGGRIRHANVSYDRKFPIVLPAKNNVTKLIIRQEHIKQLHGGVDATLYSLRSRYWPLSGRNTVKNVIRNCIRCFRARPKAAFTKMADLPAERLEPLRPFFKVSMDVGGPFYIKQGGRSSKKVIKSYILLFVCLSVRAYHLELITDLSSETFINALKRFTARRGGVSLIVCDNATNFHGANNELRMIAQFLKGDELRSSLSDHYAFCNIKFKFTPPGSPHFNGLAERSIKSVKSYIKKIAGNAHLTYEEMYTLLTSVEAILNSRPLTPLSSDPNDLLSLTPAHFIIGESLTTPVENDLTPLNINRLSRWERVQQLRQHFWRRFQTDVLCQLQERCKWRQPSQRKLQIGDLVLVVDNNAPVLCWKLARVIAVHKGKDDLIRVVDLKTSTGVLTRAITKVCPLPHEV